MSWRFRHSFKIIPGLKLNLSKSGLSASIGGAPFTVNVGSHGLYGTASIPGTGVSFRQRLSGNPEPQHKHGAASSPDLSNSHEDLGFPASVPAASNSASSLVREIRSASTELLTSESLQELKRLIQTADEERKTISTELAKAVQEADRASARFKSWDTGFLFKKLFKNSFAVRKAEFEISSARKSELEDQLRLTTIATQIDLAKEQAEPFFRMRDDFTSLAECTQIWDIKSERATDKYHERTIAEKSVDRERVAFSLGRCDLIQWEQEVPHLKNVRGGDIFLYPGFILYRASQTAFSVLDFHDVKLTKALVQFTESEKVPSDSKIIGHTWAKTNKDGSRDRRFANNHQIPIALYGQLILKSETGLWEEYLFSAPERLERFVKTWSAFVTSFDRSISLVFAPEIFAGSAVGAKPVNSARLEGADVHFECNKCHQPIMVDAETSGQEFQCPECGEKLVVPQIPS